MHSGQGATAGICHQATYYDGPDHYLSAVLPFVQDGLAGAEPVLALLPDAGNELIRGGLDGLTDDIIFRDMSDVGRNPGRIISSIWDFISKYPGRAVRVVAESLWPARSPAEGREAARYEALLNVAFATTPVSILCPYDVGRLKPTVMAHAGRTHPEIRTAGGCAPSPDYVAGRVPRFAARPLSPVPPGAVALTYARELRAVREFVAAQARAAGLDDDRAGDLVLAVGEIAANTLRHATGTGAVWLWRHDGEVICQVSDHGWINDPLAGRRRPPEASGLGLWVVNQVCDLVELRSSRHGTTVRTHMRLPSA
jgi:anti-sigma regulatory factor (Ser/Thr protein kinase)